ncbi:MAG: beta-lactamase family protein [Cytophagales bacterium]|nr:beta-lactamase family protein [Cytophagales bacterium]
MRWQLSFVVFLLCVISVRCDVIDDFVREKMAEGDVGGLSGSVLYKDNVLWSNSYGYMEPASNQSSKCTEDTIFMLASISKTIMSVAIMELYEKTLFALDDDVNLYLPFVVQNPYYPQNPITVRMLLTHTSTINDDGYLSHFSDYYTLGDSSTPLGYFLYNYLTPLGSHYNKSSNFFDSKPGEHYSYSNVGATLAAFLVEGILCKNTSSGHLQWLIRHTQIRRKDKKRIFILKLKRTSLLLCKWTRLSGI